MNTSMGQVAYEATQQFLASNATKADGYTPPDELPEGMRDGWETIPPVYREAWEAGAQAVLAEWASQHCAPGEGRHASGVGIALAPDSPYEEDGK